MFLILNNNVSLLDEMNESFLTFVNNEFFIS